MDGDGVRVYFVIVGTTKKIKLLQEEGAEQTRAHTQPAQIEQAEYDSKEILTQILIRKYRTASNPRKQPLNRQKHIVGRSGSEINK